MLRDLRDFIRAIGVNYGDCRLAIGAAHSPLTMITFAVTLNLFNHLRRLARR